MSNGECDQRKAKERDTGARLCKLANQRENLDLERGFSTIACLMYGSGSLFCCEC